MCSYIFSLYKATFKHLRYFITWIKLPFHIFCDYDLMSLIYLSHCKILKALAEVSLALQQICEISSQSYKVCFNGIYILQNLNIFQRRLCKLKFNEGIKRKILNNNSIIDNHINNFYFNIIHVYV